MVKIAICGCAGKMGARILYFAEKDKQISVTLGLEAKGHPCVGSKMGSGEVSDNCDDVAQADVIIDFTSPEATMEHLDAAVRCGKAIVIGTTGLSDAQLAKIKEDRKSVV